MANHKYEVIGALPVHDVAPGGEVTLDDEVYNVAALTEAGAIRPVSKAAKEAVKDAKD